MSADASVTPPFARVGIVGLGLIGGSLALALKRAWPSVSVAGVDQPAVLAIAEARGMIDERRASAGDLAGVDLIVLATPVPDIIAILQHSGASMARAIVTDVGSTKRHIMRAGEGLPAFIGGHPIAGSERGGPAAARADLFDLRTWLLVPPAAGESAGLLQLERLVRGVGAVPQRIEADAHDRVMAYVSHAPQLIASALMASAGDAVASEGLALTGRGFSDMTRLASSPADIWRGILASNSDFVAEALRALLAALPASPAALTDDARISELFARAGALRERLAAARHGQD